MLGFASGMRDIAIEDITDAALHIYDLAVRTPLVRLRTDGDARARLHAKNSRVFLKLESFQPVGSFKLRGAHNVVRQLSRSEAKDGVWTVSAGNAGQGVALAARHAGIPCSVMVVETAPRTKLEAMRRLGAALVPASYDECWQTAEARYSSRMQGHFVHPFDDDRLMAGHGTIALEILEDLPDVTAVVGAVGGGGLIGGVGAALRALRPDVTVIAAEPETAAPFAESLAHGSPRRATNWQASFVDGAGGKSVLPRMWPLLSRVVDESIVVPLDDVARAMRAVAERGHVIAEGAGACAVAAALGRRTPGTIVAIVSGGNIDLDTFASIVASAP
jgi:threonine dehydratase